jgi:cardiolipin synthase
MTGEAAMSGLAWGLAWAATLLSLAAALAAAAHAIIYKRDPRSATLWVLLIVLLPLGGPLLYLLFGINRYQRRARRLYPGDGHRAGASGATAVPADLPVGLAGLAALVGRSTGLPLTAGNRIEPLDGGQQVYPAMLAAIDTAQRSIALASYIFDRDGIGGAFVQALLKAHARGVQVRVLIDDVYVQWTPRSAYQALKQGGVPVASFNPTLIPARLHAAHLRNHRKLLVVDGITGFTGGMNIAAEYWRPDAPEHACRDLHFRLRGPVVSHLAQCFADDWFDTTGERLATPFWGPPADPAEAAGTSWARGIEAGPDETMDRLRWTFMGALSAARQSVRIWTPYFVPDQAMIAALSTAALRGVQIDVLTPAESDHPMVQWAARAHYWQVLEHGARIFERPGPFDHSKLMLVDDSWCCLGSANWDARSLRLNFEFNVEFYDLALCQQLAAQFDAVRDASRALSPEALRARPLGERLRDGVARLFAPVL